mgnify:CR=1 FL=1|tara:strand:- start:507 stop:812 length:306 start_codon:yes stop_codon:yes gene_type:complete
MVKEVIQDDAPNDHPVYGDQVTRLNESDPVNSPDHYVEEGVECIDAMVHVFGQDEVEIYAKIAAFKYLWRGKKKHHSDTEDLAKAEWYLRFANGNDPRMDS